MRNACAGLFIECALILAPGADGRSADEPPHAPPVALQPLAQHVRVLERTLRYLGQPLTVEEHDRLNRATAATDEAPAVAEIQAVLDPHVLLVVEINPESRVKVGRGASRPAGSCGPARVAACKVNPSSEAHSGLS
jgi:hypothetical protein